jgi:hypothetical protein
MQNFHNKGWVHGDLREANFIIPAKGPDKIMLVDFDWGGESEKVSYPTWMSNDNLILGMQTQPSNPNGERYSRPHSCIGKVQTTRSQA